MKLLLSILFLLLIVNATHSQTISVGAKAFNEGYILAEIQAQLLEDAGFTVERKFNLGGTLICFEALKNGEIDTYPEYTGTISEEILKLNNTPSEDELRSQLITQYNLNISQSYGFNNTYALTMKRETAEKLGIKKISDLVDHPDVNMALSYEFLKRQDGWDNLAAFYGLKNKPVGIEHGLAYQALDEGKIQLTDAYSTDGEIEKYGLIILEDDRSFFPKYYALSFYNKELDPRAITALEKLTGQITEAEMQDMNYKVLYEKKSFGEVAHEFLINKNLLSNTTQHTSTSWLSEILDKTLTHIWLTSFALVLSILVALPLGIWIYYFSSAARPILYVAGLLQTIPSIALLAFMIPLFGIGVTPAIVALFLYALLPILRNTTTGLFSVDPLLKKVGTGMGLTRWQKLRYVELPLSFPTIIAGIKTAAVINIGTATLAAFIGAGGLGEFIVTGLSLNNTDLILMGAIPAALLAILVEFLFEILERVLVPKHLKMKLEN
ncbi:MAG TPA: glycine betaine ABC transporter substrate-binding protein [Ignavibacteria bacterium]|nr:glycine betaine ABC transporter substrate-binding protein [Ignavibacteria bacterium]